MIARDLQLQMNSLTRALASLTDEIRTSRRPCDPLIREKVFVPASAFPERSLGTGSPAPSSQLLPAESCGTLSAGPIRPSLLRCDSARSDLGPIGTASVRASSRAGSDSGAAPLPTTQFLMAPPRSLPIGPLPGVVASGAVFSQSTPATRVGVGHFPSPSGSNRSLLPRDVLAVETVVGSSRVDKAANFLKLSNDAALVSAELAAEPW